MKKMGVKNSHIHVAVETNIRDKVKFQAFEEGLTML